MSPMTISCSAHWEVAAQRCGYNGVLISPQPDQEGNKLQRPNSDSWKPLKNNSERCPSNRVFAAAMTSALDEKWRPFNCFFSRVRLRTYQHSCSYCPIHDPVRWIAIRFPAEAGALSLLWSQETGSGRCNVRTLL